MNREYVSALVTDIKGDIDNLVRELSKQTVEASKSVASNAKKLTKREVETIRRLRRSGYTMQQIADIYDVNRATVSRIVRGIYH